MSEFKSIEEIASLYGGGAVVIDARDPGEIERLGDALEGT